jgi:glycosyltransferase involved in cell wall biosynthesis
LKPKLWLVTTVADSLDVLLQGQPKFLSQYFEVTIISSPSDRLNEVAIREGVAWSSVEMTRTISPFRDLISIWKMYKLIRINQPNVVQSYTPKAGLITMIAARMARVPVRVHGVVGMPLMESRGIKRQVMKLAERTTYFNATDLTSNSFGLRNFIKANLTSKPVIVLANGSINGVDINYFSKENVSSDVRHELNINPEATVYIYVGRLVPDKGISELIDAFLALSECYDDTHLWLVGEEEADLSPLPAKSHVKLNSSSKIHKLGWRKDVRPYLAAATVFVLPSYREGLPNSVLEAGAMSLPSIVTNINGCNEVITNKVNGLLVSVKNSQELHDAMLSLYRQSSQRESLGFKARDLVQTNFDQNVFWDNLASFYLKALS